MIGAVTVLVVIVAVFLAFNAAQGLPFVPVYRVSVEVPNAARLVENNEVRIGGTRKGIVENIEPVRQSGGGAAARLDLKLDKDVERLPKDSIFRVRYKSTFGLKYLEAVRGAGEGAPEGFIFDGTDDGPTCSLPTDPERFSERISRDTANGCFQRQTEFDEVGNTFNRETRRNARINLLGFGDGVAGRGESLNQAVAALRPLFDALRPVAETLTAEDTRLDRFFPELADAARIVAPVAGQQARMFTNLATAFEAISSDTEALKQGISEGVPTLETGIRTLPAQRSLLRDLVTLTRELRPGVRDLRATLPALNAAIDTGTPVLLRTPALNQRLRAVLRELRQLVGQPSTKIALERLRETFRTARPLARHVVPAQTACNYWNYWFTYLPNALSDRDQVGYSFRQSAVGVPPGPVAQLDLEPGPGVAPFPPEGITLGESQAPLGGYSGIQANGRAGSVPNPAEEGVFKPFELPILYGQPYGPSGQRNADCQGGQNGYLLGQLRLPGQPKGNPAIGVPDLPGSRGRSTLFYNRDGTREIVDSRRPARQPEAWKGLEP